LARGERVSFAKQIKFVLTDHHIYLPAAPSRREQLATVTPARSPAIWRTCILSRYYTGHRKRGECEIENRKKGRRTEKGGQIAGF
jgi:hypothetical protein